MRHVGKAIESTLKSEFPSVLKTQITRRVPTLLRDMFKRSPNRHLTKVGFEWAFLIEIQRYWPDFSKRQAIRELWEFLDADYGDPNYVWTTNAAAEVAREFVEQYGEPSQ